MPIPLTTYKDLVNTYQNNFGVLLNDIAGLLFNLKNQMITDGFPAQAAIVTSIRSKFVDLYNKYSNGANTIRQQTYNAFSWIDGNWGGTPPTVDMDTILNAMLIATFAQLEKFIGIEDAYRVALWNAPFNAEFYAALARGFQKWPIG